MSAFKEHVDHLVTIILSEQTDLNVGIVRSGSEEERERVARVAERRRVEVALAVKFVMEIIDEVDRQVDEQMERIGHEQGVR